MVFMSYDTFQHVTTYQDEFEKNIAQNVTQYIVKINA
jgi:hypothetical protein